MKKLLIAIMALFGTMATFATVISSPDQYNLDDGGTYVVGISYDDGISYKHHFRTTNLETNQYEIWSIIESGSAKAVRNFFENTNGNTIVSSYKINDPNSDGTHREYLKVNTWTNLYDVLNFANTSFCIQKKIK